MREKLLTSFINNLKLIKSHMEAFSLMCFGCLFDCFFLFIYTNKYVLTLASKRHYHGLMTIRLIHTTHSYVNVDVMVI
jgi:hypothetical protein